MAVYSITDLEKLTGIKAHTIRIWEKRYDIIQPKRTDTNIRYYLDEDLKNILNIALLNRKGIKISKIACMSNEQMLEKVAELSDINVGPENQLDALTLSMIDLDEYNFDKIINSNIKQHGFEHTLVEMIYPLLDKLSLMCLTGSIKPVHENFMSYLIRRKIISAIDKLPIQKERASTKFMIFLSEGELQELSLLLVHYLLKSRNFQIVNIGMNNSINDVMEGIHASKPDYCFAIFNDTNNKIPVHHIMNTLVEQNAHIKFLISGYRAVSDQEIKEANNLEILANMNDVVQYLDFVKV